MPRPGARQRRLGQNFLADAKLLDAIVRDARVGPDEVVLEVGGGGGALTERLAPRVRLVHVVEVDERLRGELESLAGELGNVDLHWGDAMRIELPALEPVPTAMVSNLPYSIATPLILRTIAELPELASWTVLVQREIADRLRAAPGSRLYGAPSVLVQAACEVEVLRRVDPAVFVPRPRVESALLGLRRHGPALAPAVRRLVRGAFAHRRKSIPRSLALSAAREGPACGHDPDRVRAALRECGIREDARAETLTPDDFRRLAAALER